MRVPSCFLTLLLCLPLSLASQTNDPFAPARIADMLVRANQWQTAHPQKDGNNRNWERGTWHVGIMSAYQATKDERFLNQALQWGEQHKWQVGTEDSGANKLFCTITYLELFQLKKDPAMIQPTIAWLATNAPNSPGGAEHWFFHAPAKADIPTYADSLYAMPALALLHKSTGDEKYLRILHHFSRTVFDDLYDDELDLLYRDKHFIGKTTPAGKKVVWSRGNGWVFAGLPRTIELIPSDDPRRSFYVERFKSMAAAIAKCQAEDGLWRPNLADPEHPSAKESSGTAFFCYGFAWGIRNGLLDKETYLPVVRKAWAALANSLRSDGMVQWGQLVGDRPEQVLQDHTHEYVTGAFLQAGSEVLRLQQAGMNPGE